MDWCAISGQGSVIFGHGRRGAMTACGLRTEDPVIFLERGGEEECGVGDSVLWMSCYSAASLWLSVGLNWMSEAVSFKSTSYQLSALKTALWNRLCVFIHDVGSDCRLPPFGFLPWDTWKLKDCLPAPCLKPVGIDLTCWHASRSSPTRNLKPIKVTVGRRKKVSVAGIGVWGEEILSLELSGGVSGFPFFSLQSKRTGPSADKSL